MLAQIQHIPTMYGLFSDEQHRPPREEEYAYSYVSIEAKAREGRGWLVAVPTHVPSHHKFVRVHFSMKKSPKMVMQQVVYNFNRIESCLNVLPEPIVEKIIEFAMDVTCHGVISAFPVAKLMIDSRGWRRDIRIGKRARMRSSISFYSPVPSITPRGAKGDTAALRRMRKDLNNRAHHKKCAGMKNHLSKLAPGSKMAGNLKRRCGHHGYAR